MIDSNLSHVLKIMTTMLLPSFAMLLKSVMKQLDLAAVKKYGFQDKFCSRHHSH